MPDCRGVGESRIYIQSVRKKVPLRDLSLSLASQYVWPSVVMEDNAFLIDQFWPFFLIACFNRISC